MDLTRLRMMLIGTACSLALAGCRGGATELPAPTGTAETAPTAAPTSAATAAPPPTEAAPPTGRSTEAPLGDPIRRLDPRDAFTLRRVHMLDGLNGWAVAALDEIEHLLLTEDGGATWLDVSPPAALPESTRPRLLRLDVSSTEPFRAWVTFYLANDPPNRAAVWRTEDAGFSWTQLSPVEVAAAGEGYGAFMSFTDPSTGWYLAASYLMATGIEAQVTLFRTFDSGESWSGEPLGACLVTGMDLGAGGYGWVTESCLDPVAAGVPPTFWATTDGGQTWRRVELPTEGFARDQPTAPVFCETHSPQSLGAGLGGVGVTCYSSDHAGEVVLQLHFTTTDGWANLAGNSYPGGLVQMADEFAGWALGRQIHRTQDGGATWERIKTVAWDGAFSFIDRWRGWAVASAEEEVALVKTSDGGRTWELMPADLLPQDLGTLGEPCLLSVERSVPAYFRPSFASEVFADLDPGYPVYVTARTAGGWIGFDPGVPQAANIGVFHHRWIPPAAQVSYEGDCADLPQVVGPPPGLCFTMPMGWVTLYERPEQGARRVVTLTTGEYAEVEGRSEAGWLRVDLSPGNTGLDQRGWMQAFDANFNGPCSELPILPGG